ncbi:MAG TPA: L,D-transpeptidase family protein [Povalibacter sp.]|uniref:L,D-transpeptidase family protein n=1 Tax=Povalibacter sp. TaxID=1962978 RepID=UPI002C08EE36|nr:L,D-transpeptidase family protein [Povalibacter sp.]HMN45793.1 L,D-transpeptidase family protein [Povalibacter sp.]
MNLRIPFALRLAVAAFVLHAGAATADVVDPVARAISAELDAVATGGTATVHGAGIAMTDLLEEFYSRRQYQPAWTQPQVAAQLRKALADSYADGLDPADYYLPLLEELSAQAETPTAAVTVRGQYDILMTEALLRLGYHLSFGKVDPQSFDSQWNYGRTLERRDVAREIESAIAAQDVYRRIEALKPTHRLYVGLRQELARYRDIDAAGGWSALPAGPTIKAGMADDRVPMLRARLVATGDLDAAAVVDSPLYDPVTEAAVRRFQQRTGSDVDGAIGPATLAALNVSPAERIRQLRINLDRGRVLLQDLPSEFVVVNIAGFTIYLVRGEDIVWNARVQVGKTYRKTPIFRSDITYLVFNPTWTVPPGIIQNDILPAARRDPDSITRRGLKVIDRSGRVISPSAVDWSQYRSGNIPYTLRQDPGPGNALGRVKLMFPNPYLVYLHDTPSQGLFERAERTFSSGCVRVERALELAERVLADPERWNEASIARTVAAGQLQNVTLGKKIPVLLAYWTAWSDQQGLMNFRRDIYGQDERWLAALDAPFRIRARPLFAE